MKQLLILVVILLVGYFLINLALKKSFNETSYLNYMRPRIEATQKNFENLGLSKVELAERFNEFLKQVESYEQDALKEQGFKSVSDLSTEDWARLNLIREKLVSEYRPQSKMN